MVGDAVHLGRVEHLLDQQVRIGDLDARGACPKRSQRIRRGAHRVAELVFGLTEIEVPGRGSRTERVHRPRQPAQLGVVLRVVVGVERVGIAVLVLVVGHQPDRTVETLHHHRLARGDGVAAELRTRRQAPDITGYRQRQRDRRLRRAPRGGRAQCLKQRHRGRVVEIRPRQPRAVSRRGIVGGHGMPWRPKGQRVQDVVRRGRTRQPGVGPHR